MEKVDYPRNESGDMAAVIHPNLQVTFVFFEILKIIVFYFEVQFGHPYSILCILAY
jgi:hypothetical protein